MTQPIAPTMQEFIQQLRQVIEIGERQGWLAKTSASRLKRTLRKLVGKDAVKDLA